MAMRLACPACGASFAPDPADAGRVLPCPGCGRSVQMPPARPVAAKPTAPRRATAPEPARGWLLALAMLFGAALVGLGLGAGTAFVIGRAQPREQPVAEKPPAPAAPVQEPLPKVDPPRTDPPKPKDPPAPQPAVADPPPRPGPPPPKPQDPPAARGPVLAANALPGLKFYLPCDAFADGQVTEAVSGKPVGTGVGLELTDGPRGPALRLAHDRGDTNRRALDLADARGALTVPAGRPFTLAFWVRRAQNDAARGSGAFLLEASADPNEMQVRIVSFQMLPNTPADVSVSLHDASNRTNRNTLRSANPLNTVADPTAWNHLALVRDEAGHVRLLVNGAAAPGARPIPFPGELRYDAIGLVRSDQGKTVIDLDEFCLFDRALTADEIDWLAGRKPLPKHLIAVAPPKGPPVIGPREVAPPPREVAAAPKGPPAAVVPVKASAPAGVDPKGLKVYLPFEELDDEKVREGVSGKFLGACAGVDLVAGPRGKAARIALERADRGLGTCKLDFADLAERVAVPAGKPFTLALWVREEARDPMSRGGSTVLRLGARPNREYDRALQIGFGANGVVHFSARSTPDRLDPKRETAVQWATVANAAKWQHLAIVRDEKNLVRVYLNGKHVPPPGRPDPVWDGPLGYDRFLFGDPDQTRTVLEVDEFCLFERALAADELKKLAEPAK